MLMDAFVLSCLASVAYAMSYNKLPGKIQKFLVKHGLLTDLLTGVITYITLGGTLTALTAGIMVGILTSAILYVINNKQDFLYLWDLKQAMKVKMSELKKTLNEYGTQYRESRATEARVINQQLTTV